MKTSLLSKVARGPQENPVRAIVYGIPGVGKSTFAAGIPNAIFLCSERGTSELDVARFPQPEAWCDALECVNELLGEHEYKTLIVDTADWLEPMVYDLVCKEGDEKCIADFDWGKGYARALDEWRNLLFKLDMLVTEKKMNIVLLAHAQITTFKNPEGADYDRYDLKCNTKLSGLLTEWADEVLYLRHDDRAIKEPNSKAKAVGGSKRVLCSQHTAAYAAKSHHDIPEKLEIGKIGGWMVYQKAIENAKKIIFEKKILTDKIGVLASKLDDETRGKVERATAAAETIEKLQAIVTKLETRKENA